MFSLYPAWFRHYDPPYVWSHPRKTAPGNKRILLHPRPLPFGTLPFPSESAGHFYGSLSTPIAIDAQIEEFEDFPLKFDPGTQLGYNNAGYSMLVKVIEEVSDASFDDYLQTKIFTPKRMNQTAADWDSASQDLAIGYEKVDGEFIRSPADQPSHFVGAGTTYSTVDDTYRWYQAVYVDGSMREFSLGGGDGRVMDYRAVCKEGPAYGLPIAGCSPWMSCQNSGTVSWK